ncbi:hypothetical protein HNR31_003096 [Anoxybacillus caldiproteolyticus]|uniref:Uncharacterized protein n=2 Tax=Thermaerobacillus caldiproteolyticus TaxID=247480 RepID=A0A7V9Z9A4_9BACL|nr:hypothetical protein [Anoxybacillus caldiproteolyticus]
MMSMIRHNEAFCQLITRYDLINPLRKKQSIVVLCGKLLKGTARGVYEAPSVRCEANDAGHLWSRNASLMPACLAIP